MLGATYHREELQKVVGGVHGALTSGRRRPTRAAGAVALAVGIGAFVTNSALAPIDGEA